MSDLEPLQPREAYELWIQRQKSDKSESTVRSYGYRVEPFVDWLEENGVENLNDVTGRDLVRFESERRGADVEQATLNNQFGSIKLFLAFCESIEAVPEGTAVKVDPPKLSKDERVNREKLPSERAHAILDNLSRYRYASRDHVLVLLMWRTSARLGALRSLDVEDVFLEEGDVDRLRYQEDMNVEESVFEKILADVETPFVYFRHRGGETPLKKKDNGARPVNLSEDVGEVIRAYLNVNRPNISDEFGRNPLFATEKGGGRMSKSGMRNRLYVLTQPCRFGGDCPHGRDVEECEAREHGYESRCPSSRSPHRIRTGSITWHRDRGWPPEVLAERANTSVAMINEIYDQPEQLKRMSSRRDYVDNLEENNE